MVRGGREKCPRGQWRETRIQQRTREGAGGHNSFYTLGRNIPCCCEVTVGGESGQNTRS